MRLRGKFDLNHNKVSEKGVEKKLTRMSSCCGGGVAAGQRVLPE